MNLCVLQMNSLQDIWSGAFSHTNLSQYYELKTLITFRIKYSQITKEKAERITRLSITELEQNLQSGELSAVEVCECYQAIALEVDRKLNCVVEPIWEAEVSGICIVWFMNLYIQLNFS